MHNDRNIGNGTHDRDERRPETRRRRLRLIVPLTVIVTVILCLGIARPTSPDPMPEDGGDTPRITLERPLPSPEPAPGERGKLGIDANVDESTIDMYLGRDGVAYRDLRMLDDEYDWEAIGGDSKLSGYVEGFEVVPLPYLMPVEGVPEEVGDGYSGPTLFHKGADGKWEPSFYESMDILEDLFPPDQDIILMCGGGGYSGMAKELLVSLGWREDHIWNAGGWWYYEGDHGVHVARDNGHGQTTWDFHEVPYHSIDFSVLHEVGSESDDAPAPAEVAGGVERIRSQAELENAIAETDELFVYVYMPGCTGCASFSPVVSELDGTKQIRVAAMAYGDLGDGSLRTKIGHAPGALVYKGGKLVASLSADRNEDMPAYRSLEGLTRWLSQHVGVKVMTGEARADIGCNDGC